MTKPLYTSKGHFLKARNFFSKRNLDAGFEIRFAGTIDISSYKQSEQPGVAGKYLTTHAKNGMAAMTDIATLLHGKFSVGSATASAGYYNCDNTCL